MGKTLETFDFDRLPNLNRTHIHDLATGRYIDEKVAVLIAGPTGTGKSHLAQALGNCAARQGHDVVFATQTKLLNSLHTARATCTYERKLKRLASVPVLIVDDFALKPLRSPHDEDFHDLIAERYESAATILASNLDFSEWGDAFAGNRILGAATLDRLRHGAYRIVLDGDSFRTPRTMLEPDQTRLAKSAKKSILESVRIRALLPFKLAPLRRSSPASLRRSVTSLKPAELKAAYRFFDNAQIDTDGILAPYIAQTLGRMRQMLFGTQCDNVVRHGRLDHPGAPGVQPIRS
jgi:energy-coupling factor transporter ATP-binding protein EcfA2